VILEMVKQEGKGGFKFNPKTIPQME